MNILLALLKREILENSSIWKVPLIMLVIGLLVRVSLSVGSLAIDINLTDIMNIDETVTGVVDGAVSTALSGSLWFVNGLITVVMVLVSFFYALSCLYTERQDQSILFWRSLPISDAMTVASKLVIALVLIPLLIIVCHLFLAIIFLGGQSIDYLSEFFQISLLSTVHITIWILLPLVSWSMLCSEIAKKAPFLLAFIAPVILFAIDQLFLSAVLTRLIVSSLYLKEYGSLIAFIAVLGFSALCVFIATIKRSQRI